MKIIFTTFFLLLFSVCSSQSFIELNEKALDLYKKGKIPESIELGIQAFEQCKKEFSDTSYNYFSSVNNLATYYFDNGNYLEALRYYKSTLDLHNKFYGYNNLYFINSNKRAICLEKIGEIKNAETIYVHLLKVSKRFYGDTSFLYNFSMTTLANHYFQNRDYNKAKPYYIEIKNNAKSFGENSLNYAKAINKLGLVYFNLKQYDSAIIFYDTAYDILNQNDEEINPGELIIFSHNLALAYEKARNYLDAKKYYEKEIELRKKLNKLDANTNVLTLLASVYLKLKDYDLAIDCYKKEIEIKNKYFVLDSIDFLLTFENLAYTYELKGDTSNSFSNYNYGLQLRKNIYGETSSEYLEALNILAVKKHNSGNYIQALDLYNKAFKIREDINLKLDSSYYYLIKNMSLCYFELKDTINFNNFLQLLMTYNRVVELEKNFYDSLKYLSVYQLYNKADDLYQKGNSKEAYKWAKTALEKCRQEENIDTLYFLNSLSLTGTILSDLGNYKEAERLYIEEKNKSKAYYNSLSFYYVKSLRHLVNLYQTNKNYVRAENMIKEILSIQKFLFGDNHTEYAAVCLQYAQYLLKTFQYNHAKEYFDKAGEIYKQKTGIYSQEYATYLSDFADYYINTNDFNNAILNYKNVINIYKKNYKENTAGLIDVSGYLADVYQKNGDYNNAEKFYQITNDLCKEYYGVNSIPYNSFLLTYADFYFKNGFYKEAEDIYLKNIINIKNNFGESSSDYFRILNNMGLLYQKIGLVNKSDSLFNLSTTLIRYNYGELSEDYALCLNNLGLNYYIIGDYKNAEKYISDAAFIRKKIFGENNSEYASSNFNLGNVYLSIGNYKFAENCFSKAASIYRNSNSQELYATALNNLGLIFTLQEDYANAEIKFKEAIEIKGKTIGEIHPDYVNSLQALGLLYLIQQDFPKAEKYLLESLTLFKRIYGELNNIYANGLNNLGLLYNQTGRTEYAEDYFKRAYEIIINNSGKNNLMSSVSISGLNMLYEKQNENKKADSLLINLVDFYKDLMKKNFEFMSMRQSLDFIKSQERNFSFAYSYLSRNSNSAAISNLFDMDLYIRNTTLYNLDKLELIAKKNNDTTFLKKWATYKYYKSSLSKSKPQDNTIEIEKNTESLEKEIMLELPGYNEAIKNNNIKWKDIQNKLKTNEAVISFVSFRYYSNLKLTDSVLYSAFVLRKYWKQPKYISICNESQLAEILENSNNRESIDRLYTDTTNGLYNTIWSPLDSLFNGVNRIYLSPISLLNRISFSAISLPFGGKLMDKYDIQILLNVRSIAETPKNQTELKSAFLFGDIDYNSEPLSTVKNFSYQVVDSASFSSMRSVTNGKWGNLNSTGNEVSTIRNVTTGSKINTTVFTKQYASEENFKNIKSPSIIHIATHGFSSPQPKQNNKSDYFLTGTQKNIFQKSIDPLTRSGLIMSGGNEMWQKGMPYPNHEDEILTAKEVSEMDMSGCVLATLSACETGLGDVRGSEGVFGLQRAFKMAGVHYLIVSLWKVPDIETADFMQTFYSKWLKDKNEIKDAFRITQLEMSDKYKEPNKWAGFLLVE